MSKYEKFDFNIDGSILWKKEIIGKFEKCQKLLNPKIICFLDNYFLKYEELIVKKLKEFLDFLIDKDMPFVKKIRNEKNISSPSRAINFYLLENLGHCEKNKIENFFKQLSKFEVAKYKCLGFKKGMIKSETKIKKQIHFFEKMGFFFLKLSKEKFLIHHLYFEKLSSKVFFSKKKRNITLVPNNKFEKIFYDNPKKFFYNKKIVF